VLEEKEKIAVVEVKDAKRERNKELKKQNKVLDTFKKKYDAKKKEIDEFNKILADEREHKKHHESPKPQPMSEQPAVPA
jgi:hypothetical protein